MAHETPVLTLQMPGAQPIGPEAEICAVYIQPELERVSIVWVGEHRDNLQQIALPIAIAQAVVYGNVFLASFPAKPSALGLFIWADTNDTSNELHCIAEQAFGTAIDLGGPWVVTGYEYSTQDATGLLGLVNRDRGTKRLISPEVSAYESEYALGVGGLEPALPDGGVPSTQIAYLVRGRNPSSRDGIWPATISETDLQ